MSLDRNSAVCRGDFILDRCPQPYRGTLDEEMGHRRNSWKSRRYVCIVGTQNTGRRSLARRFFREQRVSRSRDITRVPRLLVDGDYWVRGSITFPRRELDLLIRVLPSAREDPLVNPRFGRELFALATHDNASLYIYAFVCARVDEQMDWLEFFYEVIYAIQRGTDSMPLVVGTKCDLRGTEERGRFLNPDEIRQYVHLILTRNLPVDCRTPYMECSVLNDVNVETVIRSALDLLM